MCRKLYFPRVVSGMYWIPLVVNHIRVISPSSAMKSGEKIRYTTYRDKLWTAINEKDGADPFSEIISRSRIDFYFFLFLYLSAS